MRRVKLADSVAAGVPDASTVIAAPAATTAAEPRTHAREAMDRESVAFMSWSPYLCIESSHWRTRKPSMRGPVDEISSLRNLLQVCEISTIEIAEWTWDIHIHSTPDH